MSTSCFRPSTVWIGLVLGLATGLTGFAAGCTVDTTCPMPSASSSGGSKGDAGAESGTITVNTTGTGPGSSTNMNSGTQTGSTMSTGTGPGSGTGTGMGPGTGTGTGTGTNNDGTCGLDPTVTGCDGSDGYSCTGSDSPDAFDPTLLCSDGVAGNAGSLLYCCISLDTTSSCAPDSTVTGCDPSAIGFSCTSSDTPDEADSSLNCSLGVPGNAGSTLYCCEPGDGGVASCGLDSNVTGCGAGDGYSCTGGLTPDQTDSSLICSDGLPGDDGTSFCCATLSTDTCVVDSTVVGCDGDEIGFTCSTEYSPAAYDSLLSCGDATVDGGDYLFCCQY